MGYIKEPEGIDFIVSPVALSEKDKMELSAFIKQSKEKRNKQLRKTHSRTK